MRDLWVFGYGSLMWRPGFAFEEAFIAELSGYHRSLCVYSHVHRGCPDKPGLVLGLDDGGHCMGMVFRVVSGARQDVLDYLREREQTTMVYLECNLPVRLLDGSRAGEQIEAVTYVADHAHKQYAGKLPLAEQARIVQGSHGQSGPNIEYVINTADHLRELEIEDADLFALTDRLRSVNQG